MDSDAQGASRDWGAGFGGKLRTGVQLKSQVRMETRKTSRERGVLGEGRPRWAVSPAGAPRFWHRPDQGPVELAGPGQR